jgi:hypothetical protein
MSHDLTLAEVRAAWLTRRRAAPPQPEILRGVTVERVALATGGYVVRYRTVRGGPREALLRAGGDTPALYAGWYGTLTVEQGVIVRAEEAT